MSDADKAADFDVHNPTLDPKDPARAGHDVDEVKPESKGQKDDAGGALLPTFPPTRAGEPENTYQTSPAGPGKPIDGSPAVNTYTPRAKQKAEFEAGAQDWQTIATTGNTTGVAPTVPEVAETKPATRTKGAPDGKSAGS